MVIRTKVVAILLIVASLVAACGPVRSSPAATGSAATQPAVVSSEAKLNLNTATADEFLAGVPGLGNRMVREFMEYRPYISIQQFRREIGKYVDDAQVAEYEKYVFVPIAFDEADSETLQQIPGLSPDEAATLIAARPFPSADDFVTALSPYLTADQLEIAKTYLGQN